MWYCIYGTDVENSQELRLQARPEHLKRLEALKAEGRLFAAGPFPAIDSENPGEMGFTGSLIVADFPTLEAAKSWADDDPYVHAGVYANVKITPFKRVLV
ncbi:YciI family protein [Algicola sagamiensis]|uniref:YciI family protein n=1 Tax=Algicola sagamiensis TaxID=163869 RepID=UPI00037A617C|nr:YciI family protein [Algicola sagamiensis]